MHFSPKHFQTNINSKFSLLFPDSVATDPLAVAEAEPDQEEEVPTENGRKFMLCCLGNAINSKHCSTDSVKKRGRPAGRPMKASGKPRKKLAILKTARKKIVKKADAPGPDEEGEYEVKDLKPTKEIFSSTPNGFRSKRLLAIRRRKVKHFTVYTGKATQPRRTLGSTPMISAAKASSRNTKRRSRRTRKTFTQSRR